MYKLLIDSDALIKAAKCGILNSLCSAFKLEITKEVFDEAVKQGKERLYKDADIIEDLINAGKITLVEQIAKARHQSQTKFGKGEQSLLQAYGKKHIIISDDLSFTIYLQQSSIRILSLGHIFIVLYKKNRVQKDQVLMYLDRLKPYIRKEIYNLIKQEIR